MASEKLVDWWNGQLEKIQARIDDESLIKDYRFKWGQLIFQELDMWEVLGNPVYGDGGLDFIVNRRGFTEFQRDFLVRGLKHLGLWGGDTKPPRVGFLITETFGTVDPNAPG